MHFNHPETISPVRGKIISPEAGPWWQKRLGTIVEVCASPTPGHKDLFLDISRL